MEDYIYSSTYLRTIEKWLLDATDIQRMVGAKDARETLRVLEDTNYAKEFKGLISKTEPADYRKILRDDLESAKRLIYFLTENKTIVKFLLLFFDFHNLKLFFREKILNKDLDQFISLHGSQISAELKKAVFGEKEAKIDEEFQKIIHRANEEFKENPEPFFIDSYLDKERMGLSLLLAKEMKNDWILDYVKRKIDILNLGNVIRIYHLRRIEKIKDILVEGGNIKWDLYRLAKCSDVKDIVLTFKKKFDKDIQEIMDKYLEEKNLWKFIKRLEDLEIEYLKSSRFIICGPEILVSYFFARENANRNVRIIMEGKLSGIKNEEIQERVRIPF